MQKNHTGHTAFNHHKQNPQPDLDKRKKLREHLRNNLRVLLLVDDRLHASLLPDIFETEPRLEDL